MALGIAAALLMLAGLLTLPAEVVMIVGRNVMLVGGVFGVPIEVVYFALLGVMLSRRSVAPAGWYWRSFDHHHLLEGRER